MSRDFAFLARDCLLEDRSFHPAGVARCRKEAVAYAGDVHKKRGGEEEEDNQNAISEPFLAPKMTRRLKNGRAVKWNRNFFPFFIPNPVAWPDDPPRLYFVLMCRAEKLRFPPGRRFQSPRS